MHSQPGRPEGRGKIERFFRTVRGQFLAELTEARAAQVPGLDELNRLFAAWTETVYHVRAHSETGQPPLARWEAGGPFPVPAGPALADAFRWSEWRTVTRTATVSMHGNRYQVDPGLSGRRVELVFDPFDLTVLSVRSGGLDAGTATPHHITRHAHPKARPEPLPGDDAPRATGIDYLALLGEQHSKQDKSRVNYSALISPAPAGGNDRAGAGAGGPPWMTSARWPRDDTVALARAAAEAIRGLNHATRCDAGLGQPSAAYDVIGALSLAASRLGQLLTQIAGYLDRSLRAGRLSHDLGEDPALHVNGAGVFLGDARLLRRRPGRRPEPGPGTARIRQRAPRPPQPPGPGMIDKLQAHYGFTRMPFGRDLAPGMLHRHAAHNEAVARITWCISERSIGVITGEVGAGKTVSVRTVLAGLDASRHTIIYLPNPMIGVRGLHEMIVATFGGQPDRSGSRLTAQASAILAAERDERGKTPVLIIDEAHLLRYEQLETIRMLTNHNLDADSPLACLLVGQPTLRRTMKLAVLPPWNSASPSATPCPP